MPLKTILRDFLIERDLDSIAKLASERKRALPSLVSLTYDHEAQIAWRAVEAVGAAASSIAQDDPDFVREQLRRLQWLISEESGGVCWHAPEAMAEIVRNEPHAFADYIPIVVTLIETIEPEDLEHFRPGTLRAIGRLADVAGDHVSSVLPAVRAALADHDSQSRGMAVWCLAQLGMTQLLSDNPTLERDTEPVDVYDSGSLTRTTVAELYQRAITGELLGVKR